MVCACLITILLVLYMLFDVNYFLRIIFTLAIGRLHKKNKIFDVTTIYGIYAAIAKRGGGAVQGASSTRYRRAIPLLTPYKVTTKLIYWEDKNFYLEHEFVSLTDNFVRAVVLSRQTTTGLKIPVSEVIAELEPNAQRPEMTKDLELWLKSMEESSKRYKKEN
ncbi:UPF0670 protein THEM6 like protein [Eufriesea mexicana]|nr:UPF0670 protein THEM6 like protein [Eufriesea mexicana]